MKQHNKTGEQALLALVLEDGETWTELDGCFVALVAPDWDAGDPMQSVRPLAFFTAETENVDAVASVSPNRAIGLRFVREGP